MLNSIFVKDESMPAEIKDAANKGLPLFLDSSDIHDLSKASLLLAAAFGDDGEFKALVEPSSSARDEAEQVLITRFKKNLKLLVQKTWVEKNDETLKEEILFRITSLSENLANLKYQASLEEFLPILQDVVILLFGNLAKQDSFIEYAVRIDPDFGFFWYYIHNLTSFSHWSEEKCRLAVLLGICFLSNF